MPLTRIEAHNFKSFRDIDVTLGSLNVLIGANASGKSNFVQLLNFIRNLGSYGLDNALSMQGGNEYFNNLAIGDSMPFRLALAFPGDPTNTTIFNAHKSFVIAHATHFLYSLVIESAKTTKHTTTAVDHINIDYDFSEYTRLDPPIGKPVGAGVIEVQLLDGKVDITVSTPEDVSITEMLYQLPDTTLYPRKNKGLLLELLSTISLMSASDFPEIVSSLTIYDFNTKLPKQTAQITGKIDLEEDGSNLVIALKNILEDQSQRREFSNLLHDVLPFAEDVDVQRLADRFLHFRLRESYSGDQYLPASLLSDGTIHVIALIVALFFSDKPLIVIEEPERNIHPYLLARVAELLKDASRNKQIIVTTHNPEIVKNVALDDLLFVSRDREGFSTIRRPVESADVRVFLENEIGIDELFARNLLGA